MSAEIEQRDRLEISTKIDSFDPRVWGHYCALNTTLNCYSVFLIVVLFAGFIFAINYISGGKDATLTMMFGALALLVGHYIVGVLEARDDLEESLGIADNPKLSQYRFYSTESPV